MDVSGSRPDPTLIFFAFAATPSTTLSYTGRSTYRRDPAQQHWPWLKKMALAEPAMAVSRSESLNTTFGDLPPSSSDTFFRLPAAAWTMSLPTSVDPVKAILSTGSWAASAAPAV